MINKSLLLSCALIGMILLNSCKTSSSTKCPTYGGRKTVSHQSWASHTKHQKKSKESKITATDKAKPASEASASIGGKSKEMQIKVPKMFSAKLSNEDIENVNQIFKENSESQVSLVRKENNKVYLKAGSAKQFLALGKALSKRNAAGNYLPDAASKMALASGILGIVAFLFAFGPYIGFFSFVAAIAAIVLGVFGLHSARRGWAIAGIVLGVLTLLIAVLFILVVFAALL